MRKSGFTLIELLIVVAIIAILAAIAVPNFLEAQTRSKVSRCESELRTMALALESYRVDNNMYPGSYVGSPLGNAGAQSTLSHMDRRLLSTPIAYLDQFPYDVFHIQANTSGREYWIYTANYDDAGNYNMTYPRNSYYTWSQGPDQELNSLAWETLQRVIANEAKGLDANLKGGIRYDPTNGTVSVGDIYRFGGEATWRPK